MVTATGNFCNLFAAVKRLKRKTEFRNSSLLGTARCRLSSWGFKMALKPTVIPPELPELLKQFTKDAIRTQPEDLIEWSALYFNALVQGHPLPIRKASDTDTTVNLTPEILTAIYSEFSERETVSRLEIQNIWTRLGLSSTLLQHIFSVGHFDEELEWMKFFALSCSYLGGTIKNAMIHACYILNSDPNCKNPDACVPYETFQALYGYLANMDGEVSQTQIDQTLMYLETQAKSCNNMVKVSHFSNSLIVRLE